MVFDNMLDLSSRKKWTSGGWLTWALRPVVLSMKLRYEPNRPWNGRTSSMPLSTNYWSKTGRFSISRRHSDDLFVFSSSLQELAAWFNHFLLQQTLFRAYYESWALVRTHEGNDLFERLTNQLEKLSPLSFRVKYILSSSSVSQARLSQANNARSSSSPKKFNVRVWLRDRKTPVKVSPKELQSLPPSVSTSLRRKSSSIPVAKRP